MGRAAREARPLLAELFEAAAQALELDQGPQTLVLTFVDGELEVWGTGGRDRRDPLELAERDRRVAWLLQHAGTFAGCEGSEVDPRARLEAALVEACREAGVLIEGRETEIRCRLGRDLRLRWFDPTPRIPSSVLEPGFDETAGG